MACGVAYKNNLELFGEYSANDSLASVTSTHASDLNCFENTRLSGLD
jgi:hypothetical protein